MKIRAATKSKKKTAVKAGAKAKKAAPKKTVKAPVTKSVKSAAKTAAETAKAAKKAPLKKPVPARKTSATIKKTGSGKDTSGAKRKPAMPELKKPVKPSRKPAAAKVAAPARKSSQQKAGKLPARAATKPEVTEKKRKKTAPEELVAVKKTTARVSSAPAKKTAVKGKAPGPRKTAAVRKTPQSTRRPSATGAEKKAVRAGFITEKATEQVQKKAPTKTVAEKIVPAKPTVKAAKKIQAPPPMEEKQKKPVAKKEPEPVRAKTERVHETKASVPRKAPAQRKARPAVGKAETTRETGRKEPAVSATRPERPKLKIFLPGREAEEEYLRESTSAGLPEEYGENALIAMAVDPNTIFVDWEIVPGEIAGKEGELTLRFHDTTGVEFDGGNANVVTDISVARRVGNGFFVINMPGRDVIVEAGIMGPAGFHAVVRSDVVSFPFLLSFDDLGIVQKLLAAGIPVGY